MIPEPLLYALVAGLSGGIPILLFLMFLRWRDRRQAKRQIPEVLAPMQKSQAVREATEIKVRPRDVEGAKIKVWKSKDPSAV